MAVDRGTDTQELQGFVLDLVERKIRLRAHELYEGRGRAEGSAVQDWLTAEAEVLETSILAPLYRRLGPGSERRHVPEPSGGDGAR